MMVPFKVFDRKNKIIWLVLNYHPSHDGGEYLLVREDNSSKDGEMTTVPAADLCKYKWVDFMDKKES
jgi:hypothetical protein